MELDTGLAAAVRFALQFHAQVQATLEIVDRVYVLLDMQVGTGHSGSYIALSPLFLRFSDVS